MQSKFSWDRRLIGTYSLLLLNIGYFLWMLLKYHTTTDPMALLQAGAQYAPLVASGQWWRLLSASFIHIGFEHLLINMLSLYFLGRDLELMLGTFKFITIYLISCLGGNALSFAFNTSISAGASTGVFGLLVCFVVLSRLIPQSRRLQILSQNYLVLLVLNLFTSLFASGIDLYGHLGGAIFGALSTWTIQPSATDQPTKGTRLAIGFGMIVLFMFCIWLGYRRAMFY